MLTIETIKSYYSPNQQSQPRNILREYLQYKILQAIFESEYSSKLIFIGGTSLRIMYGNPRFSEDLDFDNRNLTEEEFIKTSEVVKKSLEREGYEIEFKTIHKGGYRCYLRLPKILFENNLSPLPDEKILIQIDSTSQGFIYEPTYKQISKFDVFSTIPTAPLDILLSQKIYALFNRPRLLGRDFFDITFILGNSVKPNYEYLENKLNISSPQVLKDEIINKCQNEDFTKLSQDVEPFVYSPSDVDRVKHFMTIFKDMQL